MKFTMASVIGLTLGLWPQVAPATLSCYPLTEIERALDAEYGEVRHFTGSESTGIEYRLYVNAKTGSWSWIGIPAGAKVGCLIFAGRSVDAPLRMNSPAPAAPPEAQF